MALFRGSKASFALPRRELGCTLSLIRLMRALALVVSFVNLSGAIGCATESDHPPGLDDPGHTPVPITSGDGYPSGPYGASDPKVGDVVENLSLLGHLGEPGRVTRADATLDDYSLSELRQEGKTHLLIHVSAAWCAPCQVEAFFLSQYAEQIDRQGGATLELVVDGQATGADPTKAELDIWVERNDLEVTVMGPGDERLRAVFPSRDIVYIVELETMEVMWRQDGQEDGQTASEIGAVEMLSRYLAE